MNLVKWLRKNNKKVMAVVVIVILFMFIGGGTFIKTLQQKQSNKRIATYGDGRKMTRADLQKANQELDVLRAIGMDRFIMAQDLRGLLLAELLFSDRRPSQGIAEYATRMIRQNQYRVIDTDVISIYEGQQLPYVYWFLLKHECEQAGIAIPIEEIKEKLVEIIPQVFNNVTYNQRIPLVMKQFHLTQEAILQMAAQLAAVMQYAQLVCGAEDTTLAKARLLASNDRESIDVNFVRLDGKRFAQLVDSNAVITEAALEDQFERYKNYLPGSFTEANPHGFGYMLPPRIQVEYLFLQLNEVVPLVSAPTQKETEAYYRRHVNTLYTNEVATDPNDPNSPKIKQVQGYAEVVDNVTKRLIAEKVLNQAETILQDAKTLADLEMSGELSDEERKAKAEGKRYSEIAAEIQEKYPVTLQTGRTGMLSLEDLNNDSHLSNLAKDGQSRYPIPLAQFLFAIEPINMVDLQLLSQTRPRLYESVGPLKHRWIQQRPTSVSGLTMALVRVTNATIAQAPTNLQTEYDRTGVQLAPIDPNAPKETFVLRGRVEEDLKTLAGFKRAQEEGARLMERIQSEGWTAALETLNQEVGEKLKQTPQDPNVFAIEKLSNIRRAQTSQLVTLRRQSQSNPMALSQYRYVKSRSLLGQALYPLLSPEESRSEQAQFLVFEPENSVYCIKDMSIRRIDLETYQQSQGFILHREDYVQSQSLAIQHFKPDNIIKRWRFAWEESKEKPQDTNDVKS